MEVGQVLLEGHVVVVVPADDRRLQLIAHDADALGRAGVVADDVPRADPIRHALRGGILQHDAECVDVCVQIAENPVNLCHQSAVRV